LSKDVHRIGSMNVARIDRSKGIRDLLEDFLLNAETVIVKPNLVEAAPGGHTESDVLRLLFEALDSRIVVVEGYQIHRLTREIEVSTGFKVKGSEVNWGWLKHKGWSWLEKNPDWGWFMDHGYLDRIREDDRAFLDERGFTDLFQEYGAEYVNVTEEVWRGRAVEPETIKGIVEERYPPVKTRRLYGFVPRNLFDLRGAPYVSFSKLKNYATFTLKNTFGLIPDPIRAWWHGPKNSRFDDSIVDINKVYHALFDVVGMFESLSETRYPKKAGIFQFDQGPGPGVFIVGRDLVSMDTALCGAFGFKPEDASYLDLARDVFRRDPGIDVERAVVAISDLIPTRSG